MFKKIMLIAVLVLVIAALLVVVFWDDITAPRLDAATKQLISEACAEQGIGNLNWDAKDRQPGSVRYYGHYEGYEVFFYCPENADMTITGGMQIIKGKDFYYPFGGCMMYAYKDGKISEVATLHWSEDAIKEIQIQHSRYDNRLHEEGSHVWLP